MWGRLTAGDITHGNGSGGESIYSTGFPDENYDLLHNCPGVLSMVHVIPGGKSSQFHLSMRPAPWLDCLAVVLGHVTSGMEVVEKMLRVETIDGSPVSAVVITDSGQLS